MPSGNRRLPRAREEELVGGKARSLDVQRSSSQTPVDGVPWATSKRDGGERESDKVD